MPRTGGHTIAVVSERTGLSRDVLRVWERRYGAVEPGRTAGGQRLYSDAELARFELLARATRLGRTIGSVAGLTTAELERMLSADAALRGPPPPDTSAPEPTQSPAPAARTAGIDAVIDRAIAHSLALDGSQLGAELRLATARYGLSLMLEDVLPVLMRRIGDEWMNGRLGIPHEHLASAVVLALLLDAIRTIPEPPNAPRLLVATPAGEQHVIGAALTAAAAAIDGWSILFLGADVPAADLASAARGRGAQAVALSIVRAEDATHVIRELRAVREVLPPEVPIIVGGSAAVRLADQLRGPGVEVCRDLREARAVLGRVGT